MSRILFLTQILPYPLDAGPKVRAYYVLRHLAQSHDVTLISFVRPTDAEEQIAHLEQFCRAVFTLPMPRSRARDALWLVRSLVSGESFVISRDWVPQMGELIGSQLAATECDAIHADQLWMAQYALWARKWKPETGKPRLVLDQHNAVYMIPARLARGERNPVKRALASSEARKLARYEVETCAQFDQVVWVTQEDHNAVQCQAKDSGPQVPSSAVIPICGDPEATGVVARKADARRVTFLGGMHWPPNAQGALWFAEQVFPLVLAEVPGAVLTIIGKSPPKQILNSQRPIPGANLEVTGYVADIEPYLAETAAFVVPLLAGGGMRVKIVDAWLWGLPVVSTSIGAEGIEIRPDENILIADGPETFAEATIRLLQNRSEAQRLAQAGRRWAEQYYDWRKTYRLWDRVYEGGRGYSEKARVWS
jgi:glycosyltransferase involved in cell wall biosynthesis